MVFWARWALLFFCLVACSWASENELAKKARQLYYSDKFNEALVMVDKALEKNPTSPEPYLVSATILAHRRDFDSMRSLVKKVRTKWPQAVEGNLIEADLLFLTGKGAKARRLLDKTSKSHASDLTVQLNRIILLAATGEASKARKLLEKSLLKKKLEAAEEILNVCAALVILPGGSEKALALLRKCRKLHGESSQVLLLEGMVYMREASWGRAVAVLLQGLERNPEKLSEMLMLAPLLSGLGHSKEVENILNEARKIFPHSAELKRLLIQVKARAADEKQLVVHKFDGIVLHVPPQLPKKHLESVIVQIKRSLATVEKFFGVSGSPVKLKLLSSTGVSSAAYYDAPNDVVFVGNRLIQDYPDGAVLLEQLLKHEFAHLVTNRILRKNGIGLDGPAVPSWFAEGLAEYAAGNLIESKLHLPAKYLTGEELLLGISLSSIGRPACRQAYAQATVMVEKLLAKRGERSISDVLVSFSKEYRRSGDVEQALLAVFKTSTKGLELSVMQK